ncbi:MAG TPA: DUF1801 domain-containing protein [Thermoanaerobaculia bacterium]|nr:DUF1801 domain-containing protein [Thermoanaerobaculia bacterium]
MARTPRTIDEYLEAVSEEKRPALEKLRKAIRAAAPEAEECIAYQVPSFRLNGRFLLSFGAGANHCAFYPGSSAVETYREELKSYDTSKGTVRFRAENPLPATLVRRLVKARIASSAARQRSAADRAARRR